ncbi:MAG: hypothetical protein ACRDYY_07425, partial [Acidimicrobiales bacterium]
MASSVVAGTPNATGDDRRRAPVPPRLHAREHQVHATPPDPPIVAPSAGRWYRIWRVARYAFALAALGAAVYAVSGKTDELNGATTYLAHLRWEWLVVAIGAEAVSFIAYAALQRRLLLAGEVDVPMVPMTGISVAANAIQNSLPGGIVFYAAYNLRQYHRFGADDVLSVWTLIALNAVSFICLSGLAALGLAMALSAGSTYDLIEAILGIVIVAVLLVIAWYERVHLLPHAARAVRLSQRLMHRPDPA